MLPDRAEAALPAWANVRAQDGRALTSADWEAAYREIAAR
jgi:hypothetical protein